MPILFQTAERTAGKPREFILGNLPLPLFFQYPSEGKSRIIASGNWNHFKKQ